MCRSNCDLLGCWSPSEAVRLLPVSSINHTHSIMRYRKEQGLTQDQLSEMTGYSRNHLQRVETAVCKPTVGLLLDVSEVLGVPVERLMEIRK